MRTTTLSRLIERRGSFGGEIAALLTLGVDPIVCTGLLSNSSYNLLELLAHGYGRKAPTPSRDEKSLYRPVK